MNYNGYFTSSKTQNSSSLKLELQDGRIPADYFKEINQIKQLKHRNVNQLPQCCDPPTPGIKTLAMKFEHISQNLTIFLKARHLTISQNKSIFEQIINGIHYLHENRIIHRNLTPQYIRVNSNKRLKIYDFCDVDVNIFEILENSTLSYRAPEVLLGIIYSKPVDLWSAGCILVELFNRKPLFSIPDRLDQHSRLKQLQKIYSAVGTPVNYYFAHNFPMKHTFKSWKGPPINLRCPDAEHLALQLLKFDANKRLNATETLNHNFFLRNENDDEIIN